MQVGGFRKVKCFLKNGFTPVTATALVLSLFGCLAIYNATWHLAVPYHFVLRQLAWILVSSLVLLLTAGVSYSFFRRYFVYFAVPAYFLLWAVLICGIRINGMRGWYAWHGVLMQPSELAKPAFVLSLAFLLSKTEAHRQTLSRGFLPVFFLAACWILPIALQPDFGAVMLYGMTFAALFWCAGGRTSHFAGVAVIMIPLLLLVFKLNPYLRARFIGFIDPQLYAETSGWHIIQFQNTLASGGLFGRSLGKGIWSQTYLPLGYSDSMFATIGEAMGFVGLLPIIGIIVVWMLYGWRKAAEHQDDAFRSATILGISMMLGGQALVHLSVNLGLMPPTGLTLPLFSYGGSSLLATFMALGIVESFACRR